MSDLDLDAIRRDLYAAMAQVETPDGNVAFAALQALDRAHKLLVEVERLKARVAEYENAINWSTSCLACSRMLDSSIAEHERAERAEHEIRTLRANQLPDGGEWITHTGHLHAGELCSTGREPDTHQRAVWLGPVEPIALKSTESAATGADVESPTDG